MKASASVIRSKHKLVSNPSLAPSSDVHSAFVFPTQKECACCLQSFDLTLCICGLVFVLWRIA
ncbi:hypothetical protein AAHH88_00625 [Candidatus Hodgkinia cicadicola]